MKNNNNNETNSPFQGKKNDLDKQMNIDCKQMQSKIHNHLKLNEFKKKILTCCTNLWFVLDSIKRIILIALIKNNWMNVFFFVCFDALFCSREKKTQLDPNWIAHRFNIVLFNYTHHNLNESFFFDIVNKNWIKFWAQFALFSFFVVETDRRTHLHAHIWMRK